MKPLGAVMAGLGLVLVWAGIKGEDVRDLIAVTFGGEAKHQTADSAPQGALGAAAPALGAGAVPPAATPSQQQPGSDVERIPNSSGRFYP